MKKTLRFTALFLMLCTLSVTAAAAYAGKTFVLGDTTFNSENGEPNVDPHEASSGWACLRYGIGETLFRYSDAMEIEPWLATAYELAEDGLTWKITLRNGITFSNGRPLDGEAVKECLDHLVAVHARARGDLKIESIAADGQVVVIRTSVPQPTFLNYLSDPYGCIVDVREGVKDGIVVGTGPYIGVSVVSDEELQLVRNAHYWNGDPGFDEVTVLSVTDGDTLTMALQSGELDAAAGMPMASYPLFRNDDFVFSGCMTSRAFIVHMNFESSVIQDPAVRKAIAMGIDKKHFSENLLNGNVVPAGGTFPANFSFGGDAVTAKPYDPEGAKAILEAAGWVDTDGDGIREKDGKPLVIRWLTYPSRQELPILAEAVQASLKNIGMKVEINCTAGHGSVIKNMGAWDVYASVMITAPTGDPAYYFMMRCLDSGSANEGHYHSDKMEELAAELSKTFAPERRAELAVAMQQTILDDDAFVFCAHMKVNLISKSTVKGLVAHPCDFYEITADLAPADES